MVYHREGTSAMVLMNLMQYCWLDCGGEEARLALDCCLELSMWGRSAVAHQTSLGGRLS